MCEFGDVRFFFFVYRLLLDNSVQNMINYKVQYVKHTKNVQHFHQLTQTVCRTTNRIVVDLCGLKKTLESRPEVSVQFFPFSADYYFFFFFVYCAGRVPIYVFFQIITIFSKNRYPNGKNIIIKYL